MARGGFFAALQRASREAERARQRSLREAARRHAASKRQAEQARRASERAAVQRAKSAAAEQKQADKEAREAHLAAREAEVEERNDALAEVYDDVDSLLSSTLAIDDHVELEALRARGVHPPFDRPDLEVPNPSPTEPVPPPKPFLKLPPAPVGLRRLFGGVRRHELAVEEANRSHERALAAWEEQCKEAKRRHAEALADHAAGEHRRMSQLSDERVRYHQQCDARAREVAEQNRRLDELIANLGYGVPEAVQEYVSIVLANSCYPDHFKVTHEFSFDAATSELTLKVVVPPPSDVPAIKGYKYVKASDEIVETPLSQREAKDRYAAAIHQVALRSFHEVFESDRRGLILSVALEVGTETVDPATGRRRFIPFVIAAADRPRFLSFDLSAVVPHATLSHLGAAVSKNPYGLVGVERAGARRT